MGHVISIHVSNMYHYVNKVEIKSSTEDANKLGDRSEISNIIINVTEEHLNNFRSSSWTKPSMASRPLAFSHLASWEEKGRSSRKVLFLCRDTSPSLKTP